MFPSIGTLWCRASLRSTLEIRVPGARAPPRAMTTHCDCVISLKLKWGGLGFLSCFCSHEGHTEEQGTHLLSACVLFIEDGPFNSCNSSQETFHGPHLETLGELKLSGVMEMIKRTTNQARLTTDPGLFVLSQQWFSPFPSCHTRYSNQDATLLFWLTTTLQSLYVWLNWGPKMGFRIMDL